jgi:hypothetical protein
MIRLLLFVFVSMLVLEGVVFAQSEPVFSEHAQNDEHRKAKLHMGAQAVIYLCVATMNQFARWVTWLRVRLPSSLTVTDAARRLLVPRAVQPDPVFA